MGGIIIERMKSDLKARLHLTLEIVIASAIPRTNSTHTAHDEMMRVFANAVQKYLSFSSIFRFAKPLNCAVLMLVRS